MYNGKYLSKVLYKKKRDFYPISEIVQSDLDYLINHCGLLISATPEIDESGNGYNFVVCDIAGTPTGGNFVSGSYIKIGQFHQELYDSDISNILYEANQTVKILAFDNMVNIDSMQMFVSEDKQKITFYETPLVEGSNCLFKAMSFLDMNEVYQVQTTDTSGVFENYAVAEGDYYVRKEWVTMQ